MKKHLFLTGPSGMGKSAMIRAALGDRIAYAGGFVTVPSLGEGGEVLGWELMPAAQAAGGPLIQSWPFLDLRGKAPMKDNEVFRSQGARLLKEAENYPFVVLDEIGGFELLIPQFRKALEDLLNSDVPILGVVKGPEAAMAIRRTLGLTGRFTMVADNLRRALEQDDDTVTIALKSKGDPVARRILDAWCGEYASL